MIKNSRQYGAAKYQIAKLTEAYELSEKHPIEMDPRIYDAMLAGIESQIADIQKEVDEYDELRESKKIPVDAFDNFGQLLIQARITRLYSQKDLADRLEVQPQLIQRWEASDYKSVKLETLKKVMAALDFNASVMLASSEDWIAEINCLCSNWDVSEVPITDQGSVSISYDPEWASFGTVGEAQWEFTEQEAA